MATISKHVCDRCGKELDDHMLLVQKPKRVKLFKLIKCNPDPYGGWETKYELCRECGDKLTEFLRGITV